MTQPPRSGFSACSLEATSAALLIPTPARLRPQAPWHRPQRYSWSPHLPYNDLRHTHPIISYLHWHRTHPGHTPCHPSSHHPDASTFPTATSVSLVITPLAHEATCHTIIPLSVRQRPAASSHTYLHRYRHRPQPIFWFLNKPDSYPSHALDYPISPTATCGIPSYLSSSVSTLAHLLIPQEACFFKLDDFKWLRNTTAYWQWVSGSFIWFRLIFFYNNEARSAWLLLWCAALRRSASRFLGHVCVLLFQVTGFTWWAMIAFLMSVSQVKLARCMRCFACMLMSL